MQKVIYPYVRFSSAKQASGHSYKRQLQRVYDYAGLNGFEVNDNFNFRDLGVSAWSGKHLESGSLGLFLEAIENGSIPQDGSSYLCIEQMDRLSRQRVDDAYSLFRKILSSNVNIITLMDEKIFTKNSLNSMIEIISSLLIMEQSNLESEKKSQRVNAVFKSRLERLSNGENVSFASMLPGWIDNNGTKESTNFVLNDKAEIVRLVYRLYIDGISMGQIAKKLNDNGTKQIARKRHRNYTNSWSSGKVSHLLSNECAIGRLRVNKTGQVFEGYYPAVISMDDWDLVKSMKNTRKVTKASGRRSINIFVGRLFCADCGSKYYFETDEQTTKTKKYKYHLLKCAGRRNHSCTSKTIRFDDLVQLNNLFGGVDDDTTKDESTYARNLKCSQKSIQEELRKLNQEQKELDALLDCDEISFIAHAKTTSKLEGRVENLELELAKTKQDLMFFTNSNKITHFDKNDPVLVEKAKRYIRETYAGFIISNKHNSIVAIGHSGTIHIMEKPNEYPNVPQAYFQFEEIKKQVLSKHEKGVLDGAFLELVRSFNFYNLQSKMEK
ncbi:recombinase family protein [Vibrio ostreicida]|uniref:recombinase family protein n=1 Tax=Vibrio ostreicida TaxID=526588 RepID=UPI003B5916F6